MCALTLPFITNIVIECDFFFVRILDTSSMLNVRETSAVQYALCTSWDNDNVILLRSRRMQNENRIQWRHSRNENMSTK